MQVQCTSCQHIANLDEAKVPEGVFKIRCPKCGKIVTAEGKRQADQIPESIREFLKVELASLKENLTKSVSPQDTAQGAAPAMVIGQKRALVCESEPATAESIATILKQTGYAVEIIRTVPEAIKKIDNQSYAVITVAYNFADDKEGGKKIIAKINGKKPSERRKMIVALVSGSVKTGDINAGFFEGTNLTVNKADLPNLPALISEGQQILQEMYRVFDSVLREKEQKLNL